MRYLQKHPQDVAAKQFKKIKGGKTEYLNPKNIIIPDDAWQRKDSQDV